MNKTTDHTIEHEVPKLPIESWQLDEFLPHQYPFRLIDRVVDFDLIQGAIDVIKNVTINEPFFKGHFPGAPVMPGVLMLESLAQAAGVLLFLKQGIRLKDNVTLLYAGADDVKFRRKVVPGDQLKIVARIDAMRANLAKFTYSASVDGQLAVRAQISLVKQSLDQIIPHHQVKHDS